MFARKVWILAFVIFAAALTGCQPAPSRKNQLRIGRNARGPVNYVNGHATSFQSGNYSTQWGQITGNSGDQAFDDQLYYFAMPSLGGADASQQLGFVSATPNQSTYVAFWGEASVYGGGGGLGGYSGSGTLDGSRARIHIEIWDDKAVSMGVDPVVVHIGYDYPGFVGASGSVNGGHATLTFTDGYGSVALDGNLSGQYYSGTIYFMNSATGGQYYPLGNFQVPACGFFLCN